MSSRMQYDVARVGELGIGRQWHSAGQWTNGMVLVVGGLVNGANVTESTEWLDLATSEVIPGPAMMVPRAYAELVVFQDQGGEFAVAVSGMTSRTSGTPLVEVLEVRCAPGITLVRSTDITKVGAALQRDIIVELTPAVAFSRVAV